MSGRPLLFFSGGTALRAVARELAIQRLSSVHIITTFDSGGSSATLRQAFGIPAVGDLRNRLIALADLRNVPANVLEICNRRLSTEPDARAELLALYHPQARIWRQMPEYYAQEIREGLGFFIRRMPAGFDARGASIGNLLLAGAYLEYRRNFTHAISFFSRLVHAAGIVLPADNTGLHLGAILASGELVIGQHKFRTLNAPIQKLFLTVHEPWSQVCATSGQLPVSCRPQADMTACSCLQYAGAICYPMGSFFSSVLASLLPAGTGQAIAQCRAPRIFIPNSGQDPEIQELDLCAQAQWIINILREDAPCEPASSFLQYMLVDRRNGVYPGGINEDLEMRLAGIGIKLLDRPIVGAGNASVHDPVATLHALREIRNSHASM